MTSSSNAGRMRPSDRLRQEVAVIIGRIYIAAMLLLLSTCMSNAQLPPSPAAFSLPNSSASVLLASIRPGLQLTIQRVELVSPTFSITFRITDEKGSALDRLGVETPGLVNTNFALSRIKPGETQYTSYFTRPETSKDGNVTTNVPGPDQGGTYESLGDGVYKYTFGLKLPADLESDVTHTVGLFSDRDLTELGLGHHVANVTYDFVPSGKAVVQVRDVVRTENCNQCHDPLAKHGGARREVRLCILCHQPQNVDAETGNSRDFKVMIHKIHSGSRLPSVEAGTPYRIMAHQGIVNDFSTVVFPRDIRNCNTCHQKATQGDNHRSNPSRAACGSCHDDVNFASGQGHDAIIQRDDRKCKDCHPPVSGREFDLSVDGGHTIPEYSKQLPGLNAKILGVSNTEPGDHLTMSFILTDNSGSRVELSKLGALNLILAGPAMDYTWRADAQDGRDVQLQSDTYVYTFPTPLPADASGTYAVSIRAVRTVPLQRAYPGEAVAAWESALNPVFYFGIGGSPAVPRRKVIDINKCTQCHKDLAIGTRGLWRNPEYCVLCHNASFTDTRSRPPDQRPVETLDFRAMVHRIHMGRKLDQEYRTYTSTGSTLWNENRFPGDQRNCLKCHLEESYTLPLPDGLASTEAPRFFYSPLGPAAAACLGCHNGKSAAAHAHQMTSPFGESCDACHKEGAIAAVSKMHER